MAAVAMSVAVAMRVAVTMAVVVVVAVALAVLVVVMVVMVMAVPLAVPMFMFMVMVVAVPICMAVFVMLMLMAMLVTCLLGARWASIAGAVMLVMARVPVHSLLRWLLPVAIRRRRALMTAVCLAVAVVACDPPSDCATQRSVARHRPRHAGGDLAAGPAPVGGEACRAVTQRKRCETRPSRAYQHRHGEL